MQVARDCQEIYGPLNSQLDRLNELLAVLRNNTLRDRTGEIPGLGSFNSVPLARRSLRRGLSTKRAALRQLSLINNPAVKRVVKIWLSVLNANHDLRSHVADAIDISLDHKTLDEVTQDRQLSESLVLGEELLHAIEQTEANEEVGMMESEDVEQAVRDLRTEFAAHVAELEASNRLQRLSIAASYTDEEQARMGISGGPSNRPGSSRLARL